MSANLFNWPDRVGHVGERLRLSLTFQAKIEIAKGFARFIYIFEDEKHNRLVWFTDSNKFLEKGKAYSVSATVKRHGNRQGVPQTVIERCSFARTKDPGWAGADSSWKGCF